MELGTQYRLHMIIKEPVRSVVPSAKYTDLSTLCRDGSSQCLAICPLLTVHLKRGPLLLQVRLISDFSANALMAVFQDFHLIDLLR
jgi:hypothetical protein